MKIGIINPNIIENDPYVGYYTDVFNKLGIDYTYIGWNRNHVYPQSYKNQKAEIFQYYSPESNSILKKIYDYWLFSRFVIKCLNKDQYGFLTVHTITNGVFLGKYLRRFYSNKYVFDIRDYSPVYPFVKGLVKDLIKKSAFTAISSLGFKDWLPVDCDYIMGHNLKKDFVEDGLKMIDPKQESKQEKVVLTIGQIRDFSTNARFISSLGNKPNIKVVFAGSGIQKDNLESFSKENFTNVSFSGYYKKEEEPAIVKRSDFINIVLPGGIGFKTLTTNRFYLSLVYKIPMIVNEDSFQAELVKKYHLGFVVSSEDNIYEKLMQYIKHIDYEEFIKGCMDLLDVIKDDINVFENRLIKACNEQSNL